jgi:hypothetical protein
VNLLCNGKMFPNSVTAAVVYVEWNLQGGLDSIRQFLIINNQSIQQQHGEMGKYLLLSIDGTWPGAAFVACYIMQFLICVCCCCCCVFFNFHFHVCVFGFFLSLLSVGFVLLSQHTNTN